ncbi:MAG: (2E,6E)-farnesyl diphosphate synthase [Gammaproteobacteria bacterium]|nr:(2E,6E)-farnesyl diphosphate synthase [Gammaproteobacteria bacterium]TVQ47380.1 MAG: (2E,6E)-farnesyl diphosphate synthase [Gammaproteobacteria bacterium]
MARDGSRDRVADSEDILTATASLRTRVDAALDAALAPGARRPPRLLEAMRYSVLAPGKRLRPVLCYLAGQALGVPLAQLDAPACAVEMIHAYSLIHDDLPSMDDDDLRRGRPTCHRAFDEATAILAGDALQARAFELLATDLTGVAPAARVAQLRRLAAASGIDGMAGGQALDLDAETQQLSLEALEIVHRHKTGALIEASVLMAADLAAPEASVVTALARYASCVGLAFQVRDDILDVEGDEAATGKRSGADARLNKSTYPALLGLEGAKRQADQLLDEALSALAPLGDAGAQLQALACFVIDRRH